MVVNPFIISGKVESKYFCDRVIEQKELVNRIENGHNIVLISPRRMGKTGLIEICFEDKRISENYFTFFIDILQTNTLREFTFLLGKEIYNTLAPRSSKMARAFLQTLKSLTGRITFENVSGYPSLSLSLGDIKYPEITLEEIFHYLSNADKRCIIAIDEFQQIANYQEKNVEAILRTHIQHSSNCNFIFSGSQRHILSEMFVNSARPFFNSATFMHLEPIPREVYSDFIGEKFEEKGKIIPETLAYEIYDRFDGHTYYVQLVCNEAFNLTPVAGECNGEIIGKAYDKILDTYSVVYREILSQLSEKQKELLYAIAMEGKVEGMTSEYFLHRYSLSSASSVQSAAKTLLHREILTREENKYWIADRFLQMWLARMLR